MVDIFYIIYNEEDIEEIYPKESIVVEEQIEAANIDEIQYVLPEGGFFGGDFHYLF